MDRVQLAQPLPTLVGFEHPGSWHRQESAADRLILHSPHLIAKHPWNELVISWNVEPATQAGLTIEVGLPGVPEAAPFYHLGNWSLDDSAPLPRTSVRGQKDAAAEVHTDTLALRNPTHECFVRLTLHGALARHPERLRWVTVSLADTRRPPSSRPPRRQAWGTQLDVPERSQIAYAEGRGWCSPASVSMVLAWWAEQLDRPDLDREVPEVARGVHDPGWPGTGNWPFNTAYAGSLPGLRACAARLRDLRDIEDLVARGIPVVVSVSPRALRGKDPAPGSGHLIIITGFTADGDPVVNDPWARLDEGQRVRRIYPRRNVEAAWDHAHRLAYLIAPAERARAFPVIRR